jgi:hypothetical protein
VALAARVVEVIADLGDSATRRYRYGSGFIVRAGTVLTAAHVVADAVSVRVRDPDKRMSAASADPQFTGDVNGPGPDLALIEIDSPGMDLPPFGLARVDRDSPTGERVKDCQVVGYPAFVEQNTPDGGQIRETADAFGYVPVLERLARGLLSVQVTHSPRPLPPQEIALGESQWSGMSGAPLIAAGLLLGVVSEHAAREGSSAITATPLTALEAHPAHPGWGPGVANPAAWWARLGATDVGSLRLLPRVSEASAVHASDLIMDAPDFAQLLSAGGRRRPQPFPQFMSIENDRLSVLSIRIEVEEKIRALALTVGLDKDISLPKLPRRLSQAGIFSEQAAQGLEKLIDIGDRVASGAELEPGAARNLRENAISIIYGLDELRRGRRELS